MIISTAGQENRESPFWQSRRLWSLWDMINSQVFGLCHHLVYLTLLEESFRARTELLQHPDIGNLVVAALGRDSTVTDQDREQIRGYLSYSKQLAEQFGLQTVNHRVERFTIRLRENISLTNFYAEIRTLREAIQHDINFLYFYHYPSAKAQILLRVTLDWTPSFAAFGSITRDSNAATDCYALGNNVGCVFHCMRVLEVGLKALAADVALTFDLQQWHNIIEQIEAKIASERKSLLAGADRNERLQFLSEAAKEFFYFKDGWRNYISHNRANYDEHQALSTLEHTRSFMNHLASRLSESQPS